MTMFGIKSLAGHFRRNISLTMTLLALFVGWITVKISKFEIFGLNINELTMTLTFAITMYVIMWGTKYWINSTSRNVINMKRKEFFQLVKLSMDISTEVLRKLMDFKILSDAKYRGCLHKFLDDEKHYLYHQWQGSTPCCKCPSLGCTLRKSKKLKEWLFKILYNGNPREGVHVKFSGHRISDYCLDCFEPSPGLTINQFDVTILSFFIEHFVPLSPKEFSSLNDVVAVRNVISHARNTHSFESKELESLWIKLSEASLTLSDSPSRNLLKDQISMLKKVEFDSTDIETLEKKLEREGEMLEKICNFINQNSVTKDCIKESESRIVSHINTKTECLQDDVKDLKERHLEFAYEQGKICDTLGIIIETLHAIKMEAHLYAERKSVTGDDTCEVAERLIDAVGRIDNENIDERLVVENIANNSDTYVKFKIVSAKQSCIILFLECSPNVLKSEQSFRSAIKLLLSDIVQAGNIDTDSPSTIVFQLKFCSPLTEDEINIIKHIVVKERDTTNVSPSQGVKEIEKNVTSKDTTEWISTGHTKTVNTEFEDYLVTQCRKSQFEDPAIFPNASSLEITFSHDSGSSFAELKRENMASTSRYFCTAQFMYHDEGSSPEAVTWCTQCEEFLCTDCEKYHTTLKFTRFHKTISTKEYHNLQTFMREIDVSSQCRDHKKKYEFYCSFHDCLCCNMCITDKHENCQGIKSLASILQQVKSFAYGQRFEKDLMNVKESFDDIIKYVTSRINTSDIQKSKASEQVLSMRKSIDNFFNKLEQEILDDLESKQSQLKSKMNILLQQLNKQVDQISQLQSNFSKMSKNATELQMYVCLREIRQITSKAAKYIDDLKSGDNLEEKNLEVIISSALQSISQDVKSFGHINVNTSRSTHQI